MTDEALIESMDRHFLAGCRGLTTAQFGEHQAEGSCAECRERSAAMHASTAATGAQPASMLQSVTFSDSEAGELRTVRLVPVDETEDEW